jgi:type IV pilus assembly protein PilK
MNSGGGSRLAPAGAPARGGEALADHQYRLWADWFERRTGVHIQEHRQPFVRRALVQRLQEIGLDGERYLATLAGPGDGEWRYLADQLLIQETRFFRHRESHALVRRAVARHAIERAGADLHLWSVGCATGEEAYSLAIDALTGFAAAGSAPNFAVIGSDISGAALGRARRGSYPLDALSAADRAALGTLLEPAGAGHFRFTDSVRDRVAFVADNVLDQRHGFFTGGVDIIFCQNLLIYFRRWRRQQALNFLARRLRRGGYLIVGPGESADWRPGHLERVEAPGVLAFRRPLEGEVDAGD